ncbi:MAG: quinone-dependent dihydroorotate dehydrogenase [Verrucomicrobiota bacterium]
MFYKALLRPALFQLDPEAAHERALHYAQRFGRSRIVRDTCETLFCVQDRRLQQTVFTLEFPNPVGLGAGYDKNALGLEFWPAMGFGFVEIGSVTSRPQPGNPVPRVFRLPEQQALINRMGFNNDGAERIAARVNPPYRIPVGVNVGKFKPVELADAPADYAKTIAAFAGRADFFVINVSSPNTPNLRKLQDREFLDDLLEGTRSVASAPVLLKLAPDLTFDQLDDALDLIQKHKLAGVVATNTTIDHPVPPEGGLSGKPLRERATECVRHIYRQTHSKLPIIGVGGIYTAADAYEKIRAGASLVEVWTGLIYEGPAMVAKINRGLLRLLERDGLNNIAEAIGSE